MTTATYSIQGFREFDQEFPLPTLTITGKSDDIKTAKHDALFQALDIWRGDNEGWWNGGRHGCGNIRTVIQEMSWCELCEDERLEEDLNEDGRCPPCEEREEKNENGI